MLAVIGAILAIGLLIVVHEAGHYFVARWCKMRVDRFSIGFGPPLLKWRRGETDFTLGPIPFGGFVQIHGMTLADEVAPDDPRAYPNRPAWQRFVTIFAGPATNYLFAIVLGIAVFASIGVPTSRWTVGRLMDDSAAKGKLEIGDRILSINGTPIYSQYKGRRGDQMAGVVAESNGKPLELVVLRKDRQVKISLTPRYDEKAQAHRLGIELSQQAEKIDYGVIPVVTTAFYYPVEATGAILVGLGQIVTGREKAEFEGPVGITKRIKRQIDTGLIDLLQLLVQLNVYLGLFNLLPLPALDGGRLVFLGYEMATRRRANPRIEATVHMVGIMCLLLLMVLVTYQDITELF